MTHGLRIVSFAALAIASLAPARAWAEDPQAVSAAPADVAVPQQQGQTQPAQPQPAPQSEIMIVEHGSAQQQQAAPAPEPQTRSRIGLVIGGAVMFGVSYVFHAALISPLAGVDAFDTSVDEYQWTDFRRLGAIPLAGPWLQLANKPTGFTDDGWGPYLIANGILQTAGLTMLILGFVLRKETSSYADASPSIMVAPMAREGATGLTAFGHF